MVTMPDIGTRCVGISAHAGVKGCGSGYEAVAQVCRKCGIDLEHLADAIEGGGLVGPHLDVRREYLAVLEKRSIHRKRNVSPPVAIATPVDPIFTKAQAGDAVATLSPMMEIDFMIRRLQTPEWNPCVKYDTNTPSVLDLRDFACDRSWQRNACSFGAPGDEVRRLFRV
jgi:hypothetical protein